ncbi:MAG: nuclear transport factor 2 family protein [Betaproteobacteria bacterium]|nr:nuclear transport factor 2 family protein [Betaproteobacteria bacterium]
MKDPVEAQLIAYNARDIDAFLACYTPDCLAEDGAGNRQMHGHAEMRERYATMVSASHKLHADVVQRTRIGRYVLDEEEITGRVPDFRRALAIYRLTGDGELIEHVRFLRED